MLEDCGTARRGARVAENTEAAKAGRNQMGRVGLQGPFSVSDRGRFLEVEAAWII